jgi:hypothetical protein
MSFKKTSSELDGMIYGMILGDGHIRKPSSSGTCNFVLHHSTKQKDYVLYKLNLLQEISHVKFNYWEKNQNNKNGKMYRSIYAQSNFLAYFKKLRNKFYNKNNKKILNKKILNKLTPLGLSLWWFDDGCLYINRGKSNKIERRAFLATQNFSEKENDLIVNYFLKNWKIKVVKRQHPTSKQFYISFPIPEFEKFVNIIKNYSIPSMEYKLNLKKELNKKPGPKPGGQDN